MPLVSSIRRAWGKCGRIKDLIAVVTIQSEWEAAITFTIGTENKAKGHDKMTKDLKKRRTETKLNYRLQTNEKTFCNAIVSWRNMMFFPLLLVINLNWPNYSPSFLHLYIMHLLFSFFFSVVIWLNGWFSAREGFVSDPSLRTLLCSPSWFIFLHHL